jgi:ubiquinol oxidase
MMMSSRMSGTVLLRAGPRLLTASAGARAPLLAGCDGGLPAVVARLMSTTSSSPAAAKDDAAAKAAAANEGGDKKKAVVINSYWGIEQNNKLVREDGSEWKWTCFRVRACALR